MCEKTKYMRKNIDPCIRDLVEELRERGAVTLSSCCGHGRYPTTIVIKIPYTTHDEIFEYFSGIEMTRKKRFYERDKDGYYFIPEVCAI